MEIGEWYGMVLGCIGYVQSVQIHPIIKAKQEKNAPEKEKLRKNEETRAARGRTAVRGRGHDRAPPTTGSPWWGLSTLVRSFPLRCVLCSFGASIWVAGFAYVGLFWASFAIHFDPHGLLTSSNYMRLSL